MKCNFCGREVPRGTQEFEGVTIDESGYEETAAKDERRPEQRERYERREEYSNKNGGGPKIYVKNLNGCGGGLLGVLLIIAILIALFIFFMPLFIVVAAIGVVYYLISSILGGF